MKLPATLVKLAAPYIAKPLAKIFNESLLTGIFPSDWKEAKVIPVYKSGTKSNMNNYRPISIISIIIAKTMEKLVHKQIYSYLQQNNILIEAQHSFGPLHSTAPALLKITNKWYQNMNQGLLNGFAFLDVKKAFDTVNHEILLSKLSLYGVKRTANAWFQSYLSNRTQVCQVNGKLSLSRNIITGIPQGSILGPLLFLIYVNDFPNCLTNTECDMFADDTQIASESNDIKILTGKLNNDLVNISDWMVANKLSLNAGKTECMLFGSHKKLQQNRNDFLIEIDKAPIECVNVSESLGVMIDATLTWNCQVDLITFSTSSNAYEILWMWKPY